MKFSDYIRKLRCLESLRTWRLEKIVRRRLMPEKIRQRALSDESYRKEAIERFERTHTKRADDIQQMINNIFSVVSLESDVSDELVEDMKFYAYAYGFTPHEYVAYDFAHKSHSERMEFMSDRESLIYAYHMNSINSIISMTDKYKSYEIFHDFYRRPVISISTNDDLPKLCDFILDHPKFVKKTIDESCGRGIELIDISSYESPEALIAELLGDGPCVLESLIHQDSVMAQLNPSSVNTVRCMTINMGSQTHIPYCFLKVGREGSFVDNGGAGGILAAIDKETGTVCSDGLDEYGRIYPAHPDNNTVFKGYQLPSWNEMLSLCKDAAQLLPEAKWIGWDLAYTPEGWVIVEANGLSEVIGYQSTMKLGQRSNLIKYLK